MATKENKHRKHVHHQTGMRENENEPQDQESAGSEAPSEGQSEKIRASWRPYDAKQGEKRVIARQDSHVSKSEKHKDIQDLERRMAQVMHQ